MGNQKPADPIDVDTWYVADYDGQTWIRKHQLYNASPMQLYCVCLYVALSNIFGGPCDITPANYGEFMAQSFMMFIGSSLWAYIIGCGVSIVATLNPSNDEHRRIIGMLNYYVRDKRVDPELSERLRLYFNETSRMRYYASKNEELMMTMTSQLRGEASLANARALLSKIWYLRPGAITMKVTYHTSKSPRLLPLPLLPLPPNDGRVSHPLPPSPGSTCRTLSSRNSSRSSRCSRQWSSTRARRTSRASTYSLSTAG